MNDILTEFRALVETSFYPPRPSRGKSGANWLVSRVWSSYIKVWLRSHFATVHYEWPLGRRRRLDAGLWRSASFHGHRDLPMDVALEWEWDNNKVAADFAFGDFQKLLEVNARCGVAIIQTRTDGSRGPAQAQAIVQRLRQACSERRADARSMGLIEVRRVRQTGDDVEFRGYFHDLVQGSQQEIHRWVYR